ncbi:protocadherin alpha-2-like isoform X20 [Polypterus senegalus]|uniref:protocadherin alpha-2-like isoform X20 n=1 Tax=Polypterus senegalus TaxID=55291 RepID=UPI0019623382|nr:protocadherin alpha-2-like isoform X20 [Polypterus senegalus]
MANREGFFHALLFCCLLDLAIGQISYSIPEEADPGTFVGNLAKDLELDIRDFEARSFGIAPRRDMKKRYLDVNTKTGILFISERIDREELCPNADTCVIHIEAIVHNPLHLYRVEITVVDINDNAPSFPVETLTLSIAESAIPGARFPLESASDPDVGTNSLKSYTLSTNDFFNVDVQTSSDKGKSIELLLKKALDREKEPNIHLVLTAIDGGKPSKSGTVLIIVEVLDTNDNAPVFTQSLYKASVYENAPAKTVIMRLNATDADEDLNGEVKYLFSKMSPKTIFDTFDIDSRTGEIYLKGTLDFEETHTYEFHVQAEDRGPIPMVAHCKVIVEVIDVNDNAPEITVSSLTSTVMENTQTGTVVALLTVWDKDSGKNGNVRCYITGETPFTLRPSHHNYYTLTTNEPLDRETAPEYNVSITASDDGSPSLSTNFVVTIYIADVNDNTPVFPKPVLAAYLNENSPPGSTIITVSSTDPDLGENGQVTYTLMEETSQGVPVSTLVSVNSATGDIRSVQSFDYEQVKMFHFNVIAKDGGSPSLNGNVTVHVYILDVNDNAPVMLPSFANGGEHHTESIPYSAEAGYFVTRIRAYDADSGYNALLSHYIIEDTVTGLFGINRNTGEIRTKRLLREDDSKQQELVIEVKDNGEPALSTTTTLTVLVVDSASEPLSDFRQPSRKEDNFSSFNLYLLISIVVVSVIFLTTLFAFILIKCHKRDDSYHSYATHIVSSYPDGTLVNLQKQRYDTCLTADRRSDILLFNTVPNGELVTNGTGSCKSPKWPGNQKAFSFEPKQPNTDWRYSASLRAGMQSSVHMEESAVLQGPSGVHIQNWPTVSSATPEPEAGEVSPPVGAGINSNSWTFKYGPPAGNPQQLKPGEVPENFIIPGSPAIISIRQGPPGAADDKSDFITFGKKEETKKKKKKKKGKADKKEKANDGGDH